MSKVKIEDLEYIVLEGGGARGVAYLGAVMGLEKKLYGLSKSHPTVKQTTAIGDHPSAIMDYYRVVDGEEIPVIKGIAGSSAGAITAFALALGFNSHDVTTILKYEFTNFLSEKDSGKYRMVSEEGLPAIGQDKKNRETKSKDLKYDERFKFDFTKNNTSVGGNILKATGRAISFRVITKIIVDGFFKNYTLLFNNPYYDVREFFRENQNLKDIEGMIDKFRNNREPNTVAMTVVYEGLNQALFKYLSGKAPFRVDAETATNILFDNGAFSGFLVRDFFMDMMIFAVRQDTLFSRKLQEKLDGKTFDEAIELLDVFLSPEAKRTFFIHSGKKLDFSKLKEQLNKKEFKLGKRKAVGLSNDSAELAFLTAMTFKGLNKLTSVNLGLCVSNYTTDLPIYFGHEWTPDFLVMEAVAGTMAIPPALKPIYNESNVVRSESKRVAVKTAGFLRTDFVDLNGNFKRADYDLFQFVVKKALQQKIGEKENYIDLNNEIDLNTFLPELRKIVIGDYKLGKLQEPDTGISTEVTMSIWQGAKEQVSEENEGQITYTVDYELYRFFYNAMYKGMFLDGGYRQNIPYNFFRLREGNINTVLAIKLDGSFPPDLMARVFRSVHPHVAKLPFKLGLFENTTFPVETDPKSRLAKEQVLLETRKIFEHYIGEKGRKVRLDKKAVENLASDVLKKYVKESQSKPWEIRRSIFSFIGEAFSYGSELGQIKYFTDHNHILPLYDHGVTLYDFDLKKVGPMMDLSKEEAEHAVQMYFS